MTNDREGRSIAAVSTRVPLGLDLFLCVSFGRFAGRTKRSHPLTNGSHLFVASPDRLALDVAGCLAIREECVAHYLRCLAASGVVVWAEVGQITWPAWLTCTSARVATHDGA